MDRVLFNDQPPSEPMLWRDGKEQILVDLKAVSNIETVI